MIEIVKLGTTTQQRIDKKANIREMIANHLLPLVSPYDLSDKQKLNQFHNNPYFQNAVNNITDFIIREGYFGKD